MCPRQTSTGDVLERMVLPALRHGRYEFRRRVNIGRRPGGGAHIIDLLVVNESRSEVPVSMKWQEVSGTAEQKVPFEVLSLIYTIRTNPSRFRTAYLVLGGPGWSLRDFYTRGGLLDYIPDANLVRILTLENFIRLANQGRL